MSSHHIVRDEQEPAILLIEFKKEYWAIIEELLGWTPTVIVNETAVNDVLIKGFKIDVVICQKKNLSSLKELLVDQQPVSFLLKQEEGLSSVATNYLIERGHKEINIFGDFDAQKSLPINRMITAIWYDFNYRYVLSNNHSFKKWMLSNRAFCILPTKPKQLFTVENALKTVLKNAYSVTSDGKVVISSEEEFWIGEPY